MAKRYNVEGKANGYVQLYDEIRKVGSKISRSGKIITKEDQKSFYYFNMLEFYVNGVLLQAFRIKKHRARMRQAERSLHMMSAKLKESRVEDLRSRENEISNLMDGELVVTSILLSVWTRY